MVESLLPGMLVVQPRAAMRRLIQILCAVEPELPASFYVRAIESPSCCWTTWDAIHQGEARDPWVQAKVPERARSSPIRVHPAAGG